VAKEDTSTPHQTTAQESPHERTQLQEMEGEDLGLDFDVERPGFDKERIVPLVSNEEKPKNDLSDFFPGSAVRQLVDQILARGAQSDSTDSHKSPPHRDTDH